MRILFVQESDWIKRNTHQQHHLAELMSLKGHKVRVIDYAVMHKLGLYSKRCVFSNVTKIYDGAKVKVIRPGFLRIPFLDYISLLFTHRRELARQMKEFQPDVVVGFGILNSALALRIARKNNIPFIYYWIDVLHELIPFAPFRIIGEIIEGKILKGADRVLVINKSLKRYVSNLGASWEKIGILGAGVDFKRFNKALKGREIRERYGFKERDIVLLFIGWLYNFSGIEEVVLGLTKNRYPHIKLLVVGDGDAYESLLALQKRLQGKKDIYIVGKQSYEQIPQYIATSDICILPAYPENRIMKDIVPIKIYEYMAMGKPVIATRLPAVMDEFPADCGIAYIEKPADVAFKVCELIHRNKLKEMGEKAYHSVRYSSWGKITDKFEQTIIDMVKEKRSGKFV